MALSMAILVTLFSSSSATNVHVTTKPDKILETMNAVRTRVSDGSNLQKLEWNVELAELAQTHADRCTLAENLDRETSSYFASEIGESRDIQANVVNSHTYIRDVIKHWESLGDLYEYDTNVMKGSEASLYTQLVWATTSQVGCGVNVCGIDGVENHFLVCNFQPSGNEYGKRPYTLGMPCSKCPLNKPVCSENLCLAESNSKTGAEPHFSVRLSTDQLLCFSMRGHTGTSINLIGTDDLEVNAIFVNHLKYSPPDDSLDAIEILIGERRVIVNVTSSKVYVDGTKLSIEKVQKVILTGSTLSLSMVDEMSELTNNVNVMIDHLSFNFMITNFHIDVMVSNEGEVKHYNGLLGQFLQPGVTIDEAKKELTLPNHTTPLPVKQQLLSSFIHTASTQEDSCWSPVITKEGMVKGVSIDHDVRNFFSTSDFMFATTNFTNV